MALSTNNHCLQFWQLVFKYSGESQNLHYFTDSSKERQLQSNLTSSKYEILLTILNCQNACEGNVHMTWPYWKGELKTLSDIKINIKCVQRGNNSDSFITREITLFYLQILEDVKLDWSCLSFEESDQILEFIFI
jgi:hypothetical protein